MARAQRLDPRDGSVFSISDARGSLSDDQDHRKRAYLIAMSLRVACFLSAILIPAPLPIRATLAGAAIFLPYFAVVLANAHRRRPREDVLQARRGRFSTDRPGLTSGPDRQS